MDVHHQQQQHWTGPHLQGKTVLIILFHALWGHEGVTSQSQARLQVLLSRLNLSTRFPSTPSPHCHTLSMAAVFYKGLHTAIVELTIKGISNRTPSFMKVYKHSCVKPFVLCLFNNNVTVICSLEEALMTLGHSVPASTSIITELSCRSLYRRQPETLGTPIVNVLPYSSLCGHY